MQTGIKNVVNIMKNKEIPSIPIIKLKEEYSGCFAAYSTKAKLCINWNLPVELSNWIQSRRDNKKVAKDIYNAILRINWEFQLGTNNKISAPNKGNNRQNNNKLINTK